MKRRINDFIATPMGVTIVGASYLAASIWFYAEHLT